MSLRPWFHVFLAFITLAWTMTTAALGESAAPTAPAHRQNPGPHLPEGVGDLRHEKSEV